MCLIPDRPFQLCFWSIQCWRQWWDNGASLSQNMLSSSEAVSNGEQRMLKSRRALDFCLLWFLGHYCVRHTFLVPTPCLGGQISLCCWHGDWPFALRGEACDVGHFLLSPILQTLKQCCAGSLYRCTMPSTLPPVLKQGVTSALCYRTKQTTDWKQIFVFEESWRGDFWFMLWLPGIEMRRTRGCSAGLQDHSLWHKEPFLFHFPEASQRPWCQVRSTQKRSCIPWWLQWGWLIFQS